MPIFNNVDQIEPQANRRGRACSLCSHPERSRLEDALASGEALSAISARCSLSRQSLRRHRDAHMGQPVEHLRDGGIGPYRVVLRMVEAADRLHDLADQAEDRGRIADAVRATLAESRTLHGLLTLGVKGANELDFAGDADALEQAVAHLVRTSPDLGDQLAEQLELRDRAGYADKLRAYTQKCRALAEHQAVSTNERRELNHAEH